MPTKTTTLIAALAVITATLLFMAIRNAPRQLPSQPVVEKRPSITPVPKTAAVFFSPSALDLSSRAGGSVDILVNSGNSKITGVQVELSFDPEIIKGVSLAPPDNDTSSFFGAGDQYLVLFNEVDQTRGRVSYAVAIKPNETPRQGIGKVAILTFQVARPKTLQKATLPQTEISFIQRTMVTREGVYESVLKETVPLTINLSSPGAQLNY